VDTFPLVTQIGDCAFCFCVALSYFAIPDLAFPHGMPENILDNTLVSSEFTFGFGKLVSYTESSVCAVDCGASTNFSNPIKLWMEGAEYNSSVKILDHVEMIGSEAFKGCSITHVLVGNFVTEIGDSSFSDCDRLERVVLPDTTSIIGDSAFLDCINLVDIELGNSVETIGNAAFKQCLSLPSFSLPQSVTKIGEETFAYCSSLEYVTILSANLTSIPKKMFYKCSSLVYVNMSNTQLTTIRESSFAECNSLERVAWRHITSNISSVESCKDNDYYVERVFSNVVDSILSSLQEYLTNEGVYDMATMIFGNLQLSCSFVLEDLQDLIDVLFSSFNSFYSVAIEFSSEIDCSTTVDVIIDDINRIIQVLNPDSETLNSCQLDWGGYEGDTCLSELCCKSCSLINLPIQSCQDSTTLFETCNLTDSAVQLSIDDKAFENCKSLRFEDSQLSWMTTIGERAFAGCEQIVSLNLSSVMDIGDKAFEDCINLQSVYVTNNFTKLGDNTFAGTMIAGITIEELQSSSSYVSVSNCQNGDDALQYISSPCTTCRRETEDGLGRSTWNENERYWSECGLCYVMEDCTAYGDSCGNHGFLECFECGQGWRQQMEDGDDSVYCERCADDEEASSDNTECIKCPEGYVAGEEMNFTCSVCPGGRYPSTDDEGVTLCEQCEESNEYNDGSPSCMSCEENTEPNPQNDACIPVDGYIFVLVNEKDVIMLEEATVDQLDGWDQNVVSCPYEQACIKGNCDVGYHGMLCMECSEGYTRSSVSSPCKEETCEKGDTNWRMIFLYVSFIIIVGVVVKFSNKLKRLIHVILQTLGKQKKEFKMIMSTYQIVSMIGDVLVCAINHIYI